MHCHQRLLSTHLGLGDRLDLSRVASFQPSTDGDTEAEQGEQYADEDVAGNGYRPGFVSPRMMEEEELADYDSYSVEHLLGVINSLNAIINENRISAFQQCQQIVEEMMRLKAQDRVSMHGDDRICILVPHVYSHVCVLRICVSSCGGMSPGLSFGLLACHC